MKVVKVVFVVAEFYKAGKVNANRTQYYFLAVLSCRFMFCNSLSVAGVSTRPE